MRPNLTLSQKGLVLVAIPLIFELLFVVVLVLLLHQAEAELARVSRSKKIVDLTHNVMERLYMSTEAAKHLKLKKGQPFDALIRDVEDGVLADLKKLEVLVEGNEAQLKQVGRSRKSISDVADTLKEIDRLYREGSFWDAWGEFKKNRKDVEKKMIRVGTELVKLAREEKKVEARMPEIQAASRRKMQIALAAGVIINIVLAISLAIYFNKGTASRLAVLMDNTRRLARNEPLNPPLEGIDEVAELDRVFNEMADALAAAARKERAILENATDTICSLDTEGRFVNSNPACSDLLGYPRDELVGISYQHFVLSAERAEASRAFESTRNSKEAQSIETRMLRKDGSIVEVLWSVQWSSQDNTFYCVMHDISQRKQIERMKQEFVAMVSHDLRTPLTSVKGFLSLLTTGMYGSLSEDGEASRNLAASNIERLIRLINDLLDIEKMESGKLELDRADTDLAEILEQSAGAVKAYAEQQGVILKVATINGTVYADADRLIQVLVNLISNAVKFSPEDSTVTVSAQATNGFVKVKVVDQGRGIPEEYKQSIFDRFQQVSLSDSTEKGGSGLGLAICKAIVDQHGGEIGVTSREGEGSTFWFKIPRKPLEREETIAEETATG